MAQVKPSITSESAAATGETDATSAFDACVARTSEAGLYSAPALDVIQVNVGLRCNLVCRHCHVNSSPKRNEEMTWETMEAVLRLAADLGNVTVDITGGAPEMNPSFRRFVEAARRQGSKVIVRTNLTILLESGYEDLPEFYRDQGVELVASLPCYLEENVDAQRGDGVYRDSIVALRKLNAVGYGIDPERVLNLVYNPVGPALPPEQASLDTDYRRELKSRFGIDFTHVFTITNVPIGRFRGDLQQHKKFDAYLDLLQGAFNPETVAPLMCRHQISVGWDGTLYDCDFNLALRWGAAAECGGNVRSVNPAALAGRPIVTGDHCFACTAGAGSSCGGALV